MPAARGMPIGRLIASTAKALSRAFGEALAEAGGSEHVWLILLALKTSENANQRELAAAVGIQGATLTHHLNAMEGEGLVTRRRDPHNRRVHVVELTPAGEAAFQRMRSAAVEFDRRLRGDLPDEDLRRTVAVLEQLRANVTGGWAGPPREG
jgi:MarR family transcriptional regulator, transcriptional regulator for hemolysin